MAASRKAKAPLEALRKSTAELIKLHNGFRTAMNRAESPDIAAARKAELQMRDVHARMCSVAQELALAGPMDEKLKGAVDELEQLRPLPSNVGRIVRVAKLVESILAEHGGTTHAGTESPSSPAPEFAASERPSAIEPTIPARPTGKDQPAQRERGPNLEVSKERVELENRLRGELATVLARRKHHQTLDSLKRDLQDAVLWTIITSPQEQRELMTDDIKPRAYALSLTARKFGVQPSTIKKDRSKLRNHQG